MVPRSYSRVVSRPRWAIAFGVVVILVASIPGARRTIVEGQARRALDTRDWARAWEKCLAVDALGGAVLSSEDPEFWRAAADMVSVPSGEFQMGDPQWDDPARSDERQHLARIDHPLRVSRTEVPQALWNRVMDHNPSRFRGHDLPVDSVTWDTAVAFCNRLSELAGYQPVYGGKGDATTWNREADGFRMPTETEWEYVARAGTTTQFSTGDTLSGLEANFDTALPGDPLEMTRGQSIAYLGRTTPVASYPANPWGLHDVHGNVWEWCWDHYGAYPGGDYGDLPLGSGPGGDYGGAQPPPKSRILRGGAWGYGPYYCRSAFRGRFVPGYRYTLRADQLGIRVVQSSPS